MRVRIRYPKMMPMSIRPSFMIILLGKRFTDPERPLKSNIRIIA
jgi:hypothetical protein